jgi:hypothetical protein
VAEVQRVLWRLVWAVSPGVAFVLAWSVWCCRHQASARDYHDRRRLAHLQLKY